LARNPGQLTINFSLLARLHEASLQVGMLCGRIDRVEIPVFTVEKKLCDLAALEA
jgi:hypothetical protein